MQIRTSQSASVAGRTYANSVSVTAVRSPSFDETVPAAKAGTLTTRTDDDTGSLTMNTGHGIVTGNRLDVYWTDATTGLTLCRRGMTVGTVATNVVPIDGGAGDVLPAAATAIRAAVPREIAFPITGNDAKGVFIYGQRAGTSFVFATAANATVYGGTISIADQASIWYLGSGVTNPMAGQTVTKLFLSHSDPANTGQIFGDVATN